jgi:hypothetical protein
VWRCGVVGTWDAGLRTWLSTPYTGNDIIVVLCHSTTLAGVEASDGCSHTPDISLKAR